MAEIEKRHPGESEYLQAVKEVLVTLPLDEITPELSESFARAVISSTYQGSTTYRDAYRLLGTRKHATFTRLAEELRAV